MSTNTGAGGPSAKMVCDMDDHGVHGEMKNDALKVAAAAIEGNQEEKDISKHIKVHFDRSTARPGTASWEAIFEPSLRTNPSTSSFSTLESLLSAFIRTRLVEVERAAAIIAMLHYTLCLDCESQVYK